ncbi:hypothetical protein RA8CHR_03229 [Variovorax sp. RA8]|nr:hypothetical protein RA8CHR_03229 [Variovorax sp. RA8]
MPPTHSLDVTTATTVHQLQDFLNSAKSERTLHAKIGKDGSRVLYVSKSKGGTGFKQALFPKKFEQRKIAARQAILDITGANSTGQNTALYAWITSGVIRKELDEGNFVVDIAPLIVGELKSRLSEQIELHQQALAEKYFKGIELDFGSGKARTPFSAQNEKTSPLAKGLQHAMVGIQDAAHQLSGSNRKELRDSTTAFIKDNLPDCPFEAPYEYEQIVDFSLAFDRDINKLLNQIFEKAPQDKTAQNVAMALADNFKKLKFSTDLFANKKFIESCPETKREGVIELGKKLGALHELLHQPEGFYTSLGALTGLAIKSPPDFRIYLDKFKTNFILANLPEGAIADENGNLSGSQTLRVVPDISKYPDLLSPTIGYAGSSISEMLEREKTISLKNGKKEIGPITVHKQAIADFWRFDYEIPTEPGTVFRSSDLPVGTEQQDNRNMAVAYAVNAFAGGNPNATVVLSSVLTQTTLAPLFHCLADPEGKIVPFRMVTTSNSATFDEPLMLQKSDGTYEKISTKGMGACKWKLSHVISENGRIDYKISIDWQTYVVAGKMQDWLSLPENHVLGIHWKADFIVDGDEARDGALKLSIPNAIEATFSGRVNVQKKSEGIEV